MLGQTQVSELLSIPADRLDGTPATLADLQAKLLLVVNVASRCGLTPQYAGLQELHDRYSDRGLSVAGFPCNQFGGQEPGSAQEIEFFCSTEYDVTFPLFAKVEVNGPERHPVYRELCRVADIEGRDGDILWNFEKFLVAGDGKVLARFHPTVKPDDPRLLGAIEEFLPEA